MANPTLIAFSEHDSGAATAASEASATLTWQAGDVLVAVAMDEGGSNGVTFSIANTGTGLPAWTVAQSHPSASDTTLYAWTTKATAGGSGIVTATDSVTTDEMAMGVHQFRAPSGFTIAVGNSAIATGKMTTQHVVSLAMSSADSAVVWGIADWSASALETVTPTATTHSSASPGPSASPASAQQPTRYSWYIEELDDQVATGTINYGTTATANGPVAIVAVEITISGAAAVIAPTFIPNRMPLGC